MSDNGKEIKYKTDCLDSDKEKVIVEIMYRYKIPRATVEDDIPQELRDAFRTAGVAGMVLSEDDIRMMRAVKTDVEERSVVKMDEIMRRHRISTASVDDDIPDELRDAFREAGVTGWTLTLDEE